LVDADNMAADVDVELVATAVLNPHCWYVGGVDRFGVGRGSHEVTVAPPDPSSQRLTLAPPQRCTAHPTDERPRAAVPMEPELKHRSLPGE
jgi:hypothetical protein